VPGSCARRRSTVAARLLLLLYVWAFPLLGFVHLDAVHHARQPACGGFAREHSYPSAQSGTNVTNLHTRGEHSPCAVCSLTRSLTLAQQTTVATSPPALSLSAAISTTAAYRAQSRTGILGSRAPPSA
jgi:hypothetical protein